MGGAMRGAAAALRTAYSCGPVTGLTDAQLLERFVSRRDDGTSFEALLTRHGPMVLGVCRSLLRDRHAADDAFQATFLVLVRKADSVRAGDSLGRWLYGVARKVAVRSRSDAARRGSREQSGMETTEPVAIDAENVEKADLREALHEELSRLSEKARAAIVLCHLEGLTHEEAARRLGWPIGTVRSRLARGRDRLRERLSRRGFTPATTLAGLSPDLVPERLFTTTKLAASKFVAGEAIAAGVVPASVLTLTTGVIHAMTLAKLKFAAGLIVSASLIGLSGAGVYAFQDREKSAVKSEPTARSKPAQPAPARDVEKTDINRGARDPFSTNPPADRNTVSAQEFAAQLELARVLASRSQSLLDNGIINLDELTKTKAAIQILEGRVSGRIEDLEDELEQLKARLVTKRGELKRASAVEELSKAVLARNTRLQTRTPGAVSNEEMIKAESEGRQATAECEVKEAGITEVEVLINQTERKIARYRPLLKPSEPKAVEK